jgi:heme exporter protein A
VAELSWRANTLIAINLDVIRGDTLLCSQVTFSLACGQILHLRGQNGVGKTTLLMILAGLLAVPDSRRHTQSLVWANSPVLDWPILYIGHLSGLNSQLTVGENLEFLKGLHQKSTISLSAALRCVGLSGYEDVVVSRLSSGQQRRVSLARLWLTDDREALWLLDEPFNALDASMTKALSERIVAHVERGGRVILTSHQPLMIPAQTLDLEQFFSERMNDHTDAKIIYRSDQYIESQS